MVGKGSERRVEEAEPGKALRLSCSYDARERPTGTADRRPQRQKKTLLPMRKCRIIIQIDISYGIG